MGTEREKKRRTEIEGEGEGGVLPGYLAGS